MSELFFIGVVAKTSIKKNNKSVNKIIDSVSKLLKLPDVTRITKHNKS